MFILKSKIFWIVAATTGLAALGVHLGWQPNIDLTIAVILLAVMVFAAIRFAILTAKQMASVLVFVTALGLLLAHFGFGVPWGQIPAEVCSLMDQVGQLRASLGLSL